MEMLGLAVSAAVFLMAVARAWKSLRGVTVVPDWSTRPDLLVISSLLFPILGAS